MEWNARKNHKILWVEKRDLYIEVTCPRCEHQTMISIDKIGYKQWLKRKVSVQFLFPQATKEERELLISGLCLECQKKVFDFDDLMENGEIEFVQGGGIDK